MINLFVDLLLAINKILFNNLGLTIIFIGIVSRAVFHPFLKSSLSYTQKMRDLKPKLDEIKKKHGHNKAKHMEEQTKLYREAGLNPATGCLAPLVQIAIAFLLFTSLQHILKAGVETHFLYFDLARFDTWTVQGVPFKLPGLLVALTAVATLLQAKMTLPEPVKTHKEDSKEEKAEKKDFAEALQASQGQLVYLFPAFLLLWANVLPAGIFLYWLVSTVFGIFQQYYIAGWGGLKSWIVWNKK
ncbi:MAG: YidC/Oxa1 family membrane protein insertase [bacterium]|nr:YidC/Oxa1 family membrane protein insertase [bacterium]